MVLFHLQDSGVQISLLLKMNLLLSIVPLETGNFLGRINLKMQRSGKVKPGQTGKY